MKSRGRGGQARSCLAGAGRANRLVNGALRTIHHGVGTIVDRIHPWLVAALLPAGDVAPALTSPRGAAALGPRGASSIPSPAEGKVKVYQGFCRGLTGPSAFYRLFKQLTSINQNGAGSMGSGEGRKSLLGSRGKESPVGMGCCGGLGTTRAPRARQGTEDEGFASTNHLPPSHKHHPSTQQSPWGQL